MICPLIHVCSNCSNLSILYQKFLLKLGYSKTFKPIKTIMHLTVHYALRLISVIGRAHMITWLCSLECFFSRQKRVVWCHWPTSLNNTIWSDSCINLRASTYDRQTKAHQLCGWRDFCRIPFCAIGEKIPKTWRERINKSTICPEQHWDYSPRKSPERVMSSAIWKRLVIPVILCTLCK